MGAGKTLSDLLKRPAQMFFTLQNSTSIPLVSKPWFLSPDWDRAPGTQPKPATATVLVPTSLPKPATQPPSDPAKEWQQQCGLVLKSCSPERWRQLLAERVHFVEATQKVLA